MAFSDQNKSSKKSHEAGQRPTTGCWFLLDYSLPPYQIGSKAIVFSSSFTINFRIVYIRPIYQSLNKRIWFTILFFFSSQREFHQVRNIVFFAKLWLILSQLELWRTELPKCTQSIFYIENWPCHLSCFINSFLYVSLGFLKSLSLS